MWELDPDILVVFCSAYSEYNWEDIVRQLGRTDRFLILRKPFDNIEVRQCAAALTERWVIARADPLTGLLNRRSFEEHLCRQWADAIRCDRSLACVMVDIDFFKSINDRYGHVAGDRALALISRTIAEHARSSDIVGRYGGEEFAVLLPGTDAATAATWAEELRQLIASQTLAADGIADQITASLGVAVRDSRVFRQGELVANADRALRAAKRAGRNRVMTVDFLDTPSDELRQASGYAGLFAGIPAREIMTAPIRTAVVGTSVAKVADLLLLEELGSVPVVDDSGRLAGIVSEKDIMESLGHDGGWIGPVERITTARDIHYPPDTQAEVIFEFLCRVQMRRVVIVENERPLGIVSRESYLRWLQSHLHSGQLPEPGVSILPALVHMAEAITDCVPAT
jgi:diguanylate cyclase (GGDEF)-like protein